MLIRQLVRVQFIPRYACWLKVIERWWKQLRSLALKERHFETVDELKLALYDDALVYWN
jgi:transposase